MSSFISCSCILLIFCCARTLFFDWIVSFDFKVVISCLICAIWPNRSSIVSTLSLSSVSKSTICFLSSSASNSKHFIIASWLPIRIFSFLGFTFLHLFSFLITVVSSTELTCFSTLVNFLPCKSLQAGSRSLTVNSRNFSLLISILVFVPLGRPFNWTPNAAEIWAYFAPNMKASSSRDSASVPGKIASIFTEKQFWSALLEIVSIAMHFWIPLLILSTISARWSTSEASFRFGRILSLPSNPLRQDEWAFIDYRLGNIFMIALVNLINPIDAISYLFNEKFDSSEKFELKLSVDVSRTEISSKNSSMM